MPGFDIQKARQSGYSDDEIKLYLSKEFDVDAATKAGYSLDEIAGQVGYSQPIVDKSQLLAAPTFQQRGSPYREYRKQGQAGRVLKELGSDIIAPLVNLYGNEVPTAFNELKSGNLLSAAARIPSAGFETATGLIPNALIQIAKRTGNPGIVGGALVAEKGLELGGEAVKFGVKNLTPLGWGTQIAEDQGWISPETSEQVNRFGTNVVMAVGGASVPKFIGRGKAPFNAYKKANVLAERVAPSASKEIFRSSDKGRIAGYLAEQEQLKPTMVGAEHKGEITSPSAICQIAQQKFPAIKQKIYAEQNEVIQRNSHIPIDANEIATSIESLRNIYTKNIDVLKDASILTEAQKYRSMGQIPLSDAVEMQRSLNAGLQEFYKKSAESQVAAENLGKPIAEMEKAVESIREQVVNTLETQEGNNVGQWYREKSLDYGAAARMEAGFERNIVRSTIPTPHLLTQTSSLLYPSRAGAARFGLEETVGRFNTLNRDAVKMMKNYKKSGIRPPSAAPPQAPRTPYNPSGRIPQSRQLGTGTPQIEMGAGGSEMTNTPPYIHYGVPTNPTMGRLLPSPPTQFGEAMNQFIGQQPRALPPVRGGEIIPPQSPLPIPQPRTGEPRFGTIEELGRRLPEQSVLPKSTVAPPRIVLPTKTMEVFRDAVAKAQRGEPNDLIGILHTGNKNLRKLFTDETGVVLPKTEGASRKVIREWSQKAK